MARILTLTSWYPPHHFGGYEALCDDVMTALAARGHEVEVLCCNELRPGVAVTEDAPYPVHRRLQMYWRDGLPHDPGFRGQLRTERANQRLLDEALDRFKPDVVSVWHMGALSLNLLTKVAQRGFPMVYAVCDDWLVYGMALEPWSRRWYRSPFHRAAGRVFQTVTGIPSVVGDLGHSGCFCFLSEFTKRTSRAASAWEYPIAPVIYPGINRSGFPPAQPSAEVPWNWKLLYTGRLDTRKGTDTLLRALALLPPQASLSLLGRGEDAERARLEVLAAELGIADRVHIEEIPRAALAEAYSAHDCFIFPSEWSEPFGMVPIEAMACGTPVVATGVGGSGEFLIDRSNCLLFAPGDEEELALAVNRLATNAGLRHRVRQNGWTTADQFDLAWTTNAYDECHVAAAEGRLDSLVVTPHPSGEHEPVPQPVRFGMPPRARRKVRAALAGVHGTVFAANGESASALAGLPGTEVVSIGASLRDVEVMQHGAHKVGVAVHSVVAEPDHLPFRSDAFAAVTCLGTLTRVADDTAVTQELARVCRRQGRAIFVVRFSTKASQAVPKVWNWWRGWHRPPAEYVTLEGEVRQYDWPRFEDLVVPAFTIRARRPIGWGDKGLRGVGTRLLVGPLRSLSRSTVVEANPK